MVKKILGFSMVVVSLPAVASVGRLEPRPEPPREPIAAVEAAPKPEPRVIHFEQFAHVLDGVTVMELDPVATGKNARRVVLRPEFQGGPGAALSVKF